jgi:hypothetical protein
VLITYRANAGGCGELCGGLWAVFRLQGEALSIVAKSEASSVPDDFRVMSLVDADGDELVEALGATWSSASNEANVATRGGKSGLTLIQESSPPFHGCGG